MATACWWCGIIACANATSWALCGPWFAAEGPEVAADAEVAGIPLMSWLACPAELSSLPQAASSSPAAMAAATATPARRTAQRRVVFVVFVVFTVQLLEGSARTGR